MRKIWNGLLLAAIATFALTAVALAAGGWTALEQRGVYRLYSARTSSVSTHTASGIGLAWSVRVDGGTADFEIKYSSVAAGNPNVNLSSTVYLLDGEKISDSFVALVRNPTIHVKRIDQPGTTVYIDISRLEPRQPGDF